MTRSASPRTAFRIAVGIAVAAAAALRMAVLLRANYPLDQYYVIDDTYYTMTVARSMAHGNGPSASLGTLTSGFQPLHAFIQVPMNWFIHDPWLMLRAVIASCFVFDIALVVVLALLARRIAGPVAGMFAAWIWALSPTVLRVSAAGLETPLATLCEVGFVSVWLWAREGDGTTSRRWIIVGVLGGLAILARIDALPLVLCVAALQWLFGKRRQLGPFLAATAVTLAPWWGYAIVRFGTPIPQSGLNLAANRSHFASLGKLAAVVGANALLGPFATATDVQGRLGNQADGAWTAVVFSIFMTVLALGIVIAHFRRRNMQPPDELDDRSGGAPQPDRWYVSDASLGLAALAAWSMGIVVFYIWFNIPYYAYRYVAPTASVLALVVACAIGLVTKRLGDRRGSIRRWRFVPASLAACLLLFVMVPQVLWVATTKLPVSRGRSGWSKTVFLDSSTGYARRTIAALNVIPPGSVVAGLQTGALGWFAYARGSSSVNLDGVVNPNVTNWRDDAGMCREIVRRHVDYVADNSLAVYFIKYECGHLAYRVTEVHGPGVGGKDQDHVIRFQWHAPAKRPN